MEIEKNISVKVKLIKVFLLEMPNNIVDISYNYSENNLDIQIVLLEDTFLEKPYKDILERLFENWIINIHIIYVTKETFNKGVGGWIPTGYKWLDYNLYSKAEIL